MLKLNLKNVADFNTRKMSISTKNVVTTSFDDTEGGKQMTVVYSTKPDPVIVGFGVCNDKEFEKARSVLDAIIRSSVGVNKDMLEPING